MTKWWNILKLYFMLRGAKDMNKLLGTSEFWMSIVTIIGSILTSANIVPHDIWDKTFIPLVVYVIGRITSKVAKATTTPK